MAGEQNPAVLRRRLRTELKRARTTAGLTQREAAERLDWSASKLIRIENGSVGITAVDLRALLEIYGERERKRVDTLVDMARASKKSGWSAYQDIIDREFAVYLENEASAVSLRQAEPLLVPGLLQTEEYGRVVLENATRPDPDRLDRLWEIRETRQEVFDREDRPDMYFVVDEAVVRRRVGGANVMSNQLRHLQSVIKSGQAEVGVIQFEAGAHRGMRGPFTILSFAAPEDDDVLFFENTQGDSISRDDSELTSDYQEIFINLQELAVSGEECIKMLDSIIAGFSAAGEKSS